MMRSALALLVFIAVPLAVHAQPKYVKEHVTEVPEWRGHKLQVPCPAAIHQRNTGGSDGRGLCVIASVVVALRQQGRHKEADLLWEEAKKLPGGYHPGKLMALMDNVLPGVKYASVTGRDPDVIGRALGQGLLACNTMNTGEQYTNRPIHHMVNTAMYRKDTGYSCFIDNNDPGRFHFIETRTYANRFVDGPEGWLFVVGLPKVVRAVSWAGVYACLAIAMGAVIVRVRRRASLAGLALALLIATPGWAQAVVDIRDQTPPPASVAKYGELTTPSPPAYSSWDGAEVLPFGRLDSVQGTGLPAWCKGFWLYRTRNGNVIAGGWLDNDCAVWVRPPSGPLAQLKIDPVAGGPLVAQTYNGGLDKVALDRTPQGIVTNDFALGQSLQGKRVATDLEQGDPAGRESADHVCTDQCPNRPDCPKRPVRPPREPEPPPSDEPTPPGFSASTTIMIAAIGVVILVAAWVIITRVWPFISTR